MHSLSFNDEREVVIEENRKKEGTQEDLGNDKKEVLLNDNKHILKPIWKKMQVVIFERLEDMVYWLQKIEK